VRREIKSHAGHEQRHGKMDEHNMLRVLRHHHRFQIKRTHWNTPVEKKVQR
jgi:hypothetical protein